jgi:uncharacterized low-complexity protein
MKKTLISLFALAFAFILGAAQAAKHEAPAAKPAAEGKKEVCKDKDGKEVKCPEKKATDKKAAEPAKK